MPEARRPTSSGGAVASTRDPQKLPGHHGSRSAGEHTERELVAELELAIDLYVANHNIDPKPVTWAASANDILANLRRAKATPAASA